MKRFTVLAIILFAGLSKVCAQAPPTPTNLTAQNVPGFGPTILLTWQVPPGPWHFRVYRSDGDSTDFDPIGGSMMMGFEDHELLLSHTYYYCVTSLNSAQVESPRSEIVHITASSSRPHGRISGTVTSDVGNQPIANVAITLWRVGNNQFHTPLSFTNPAGQYQVDVDTGTYFIRAQPPEHSPYRSEWYDNAPDLQSATPVLVADSSNVTADFGLASPPPTVMAHVHGIVWNGNFRLPGATVVFMRTMQEMSYLAATTGHTPGLGAEAQVIPSLGYTRGVIWAEEPTNQFGEYYAFLPAGASYIAVAAKQGFVPEYFNHKLDPTQADIIALRSDTTGIDFNLSPFLSAPNSVQGTIRDTTGQPVPSRVILFPKPPGTQTPQPTVRFVHSDSLGNFQVDHVTAGTYIILAVPYSNYAAGFFKAGSFGVINWQDADSVVVSGAISNIDVGVAPVVSPGLTRIMGNVTLQGGSPIQGSRVVARTPDGIVVGSAVSDGTGAYAIDAVPVGVVTVYGDRMGYIAGQGTVNIPPNTYVVSSNLVLGNGATYVDPAERGAYAFSLEESYPNPFNPTTTIRYTIPERTRVVLKVFNILGKDVATLVNSIQEAGPQSIIFDATGLASGLYFYRLEAQGFVQVKKTLLLK